MICNKDLTYSITVSDNFSMALTHRILVRVSHVGIPSSASCPLPAVLKFCLVVLKPYFIYFSSRHTLPTAILLYTEIKYKWNSFMGGDGR